MQARKNDVGAFNADRVDLIGMQAQNAARPTQYALVFVRYMVVLIGFQQRPHSFIGVQ